MNVRWRKMLRVGFVAAGLAGLGFAFRTTWDRTAGSVLPPWQVAAGATLMIHAGLAGASQSWASLFGTERTGSRLRASFLIAQLGKYAPGGGFWQALGQVGMSTQPSVTTTAQAATGFLVHAIVQLVAGLSVGGWLLLAGVGLPTWMRIVAGIGLASPLLLHRRWMDKALRAGQRVTGRALDDNSLPAQPDILRSFGWSLIPIVASGAGFAFLLAALDTEVSIVTATLAFGLAWAVGFVVFPIPAGLGLREAVLFFILGTNVASIIAASVVHRLLTMVAEVVLMGVSWRSLK